MDAEYPRAFSGSSIVTLDSRLLVLYRPSALNIEVMLLLWLKSA